MKKNIYALSIAATVFMFGVTAGAPAAEAACSYPGYINSNEQCMVSYQSTPTTYTYNTALLEQYIAQLQILLAQLQALQTGTPTTGSSDVDVTTSSATSIEDDRATLRGSLDFNDDDEATVYFQWGTSASSLTHTTTQVVLEEGEDDEDFSVIVGSLDDDRTYYFRAVAKDEDGYADYGSTLSFTTDEDNSSNTDNDDLPEVDTEDSEDIGESTARINGSINMNDYEDGYAFFVYGEDEDAVGNVADDFDSYSDVDENDEDLQKVSVDSTMNDELDMWAELAGLDSDTEIFYAACVSFEDEDGDDVIICGDTESFTTDEN